MKVAFMVGPNSSALISAIRESVDNVEFFTYPSIQDMIRESEIRHVFFDRIVLAEKIVKDFDSDFSALNGYIKEYSDNTSIVVICKDGSSPIIEVFNKHFNSPLYTPVISRTVTTVKLIEFVRDDLLTIKTKYYTLDVKEVKTYTNKMTEVETVEAPVPEVVDTKPAKKGLLSRLFGGNENKSKKSKNKNSPEEVSSNERNGEESSSNFSPEEGVRSGSEDSRNSYESGGQSNGSEYSLTGNRSFTDGVSVYGEPDFSGDEFEGNSSDLDDLSLGNFGEQHVDTGFLDSDAEAELARDIREFEENEGSGEDIFAGGEGVYTGEVEEVVEDEGIEEGYDSDVSNYAVPILDKIKDSRITVLSGLRGTGVTTFVVDTALSLFSEGETVLLIDLDYKENGLLSFIDAENFYAQEADKGVSLTNAYEDDGVLVVSNGYGRGIDPSSLNDFLSEVFSDSEYSRVILDCPLDCIGVLSDYSVDLIDRAIFMVNGNKGALTSAMGYLTGISPKLEDLIFNKASLFTINRIAEYGNDVSFLTKTLLFGRGDWLSKIE